jgi:CRP-like cAMP-binding protein
MKPRINDLLLFPLFKEMHPRDLSSVIDLLEVKTLNAGEVLFEEGSPGDRMYFLFKGRVQIDRETTGGKREVLAVLDPPSLLGEMAVVDRLPRSARAIGLKPSILWSLTEPALSRLAVENGLAAYQIIRWLAKTISERLRKTNDRLLEIYAKPFKTITEMKQRIKEIQPEIIQEGWERKPDEEKG